jgi:Ni/Co efflux regulator RcnB
MKRLAIVAILIAGFLTSFAQAQQRQLSPEDQTKFDSYYERWREYQQRNDREQIASMEERMRDLMARYGIPSDVPYERIASGSEYHRRFRGLLSASDQRRFDSYYSRWQEYRATNNGDQMVSMERRMQEIMERYKIPLTVPYRVIATHERR